MSRNSVTNSQKNEYAPNQLIATATIVITTLFTFLFFYSARSLSPLIILYCPFLIIFVSFQSEFILFQLASIISPNSRKAATGNPVHTDSYTNTVFKTTTKQSLTIHIPIHTEPFAIIKKSIESAVIESIDYGQFNRVNLLISDDGLMNLCNNNPEIFEKEVLKKSESRLTNQDKEFLNRLNYYRELIARRDITIGVIARPMHNSACGINKEIYKRKGLFKKGSNLNHTIDFCENLSVSLDTQRILNLKNDAVFDKKTGTYVLGNPALGEIILLLDKDSIVPKGISSRVIPQFNINPKLAYVQCATKTTNFSENYFTRLVGYFINIFFSFGFRTLALNGAMVPLIGHNVYLRTKNLREIGWWPENRVSEDFAVAIEFLVQGKIGRFAEYQDMLFGEEVPTTISEELGKIARYAYGSLELLFRRPFNQDGFGFTKQLTRFLKSKIIPWHIKFNLINYLLRTASLGVIFLSILLSPLSPVFIGSLIGPLIAFVAMGTLALSFEKINSNKPKSLPEFARTVIKTVITHVSHAIAFSFLVMPSTFFAFKGAFSFFTEKNPVFPPTPMLKEENTSLIMSWKALGEINGQFFALVVIFILEILLFRPHISLPLFLSIALFLQILIGYYALTPNLVGALSCKLLLRRN